LSETYSFKWFHLIAKLSRLSNMEQQDVTDQSDVFAFLGDPATYDLHEPIKRIDTHGAAVFLAGDDVYKIKRAVRLPFMDSTLDKRRLACECELAVNKANAPNLYLGAVPISKACSGLRFGGDSGTIIEWAVHMRRFDENRTLDCLSERNELNFEIINELANVVVASHGRAPIAAQKSRPRCYNGKSRKLSPPLKPHPGFSRHKPSLAFAARCNKHSRGSPRCFRSAKIKVKSAGVMAIFTCATSS
jgi:hypothetical protein